MWRSIVLSNERLADHPGQNPESVIDLLSSDGRVDPVRTLT
jgi:hypothetical protein